MTPSFKDAVQNILSSDTPKKPIRENRVSKKVKSSNTVSKSVEHIITPVNEVAGASSDSGPGGWNVAQSKGWGGSMPPFSKHSQHMNQTIGDIDMLDIGEVEDKVSKNHENPVFPLEQVPVNILNAGDLITNQLVLIDMALKTNKSLTNNKKKELITTKEIIKSILGNIRKVASIIYTIQK